MIIKKNKDQSQHLHMFIRECHPGSNTNELYRQNPIVTSLLYSRVMIFSSSKNRRVRRSCFVCNLRSFAKSSSLTHCRLNRIHKRPIINPHSKGNALKILSKSSNSHFNIVNKQPQLIYTIYQINKQYNSFSFVLLS